MDSTTNWRVIERLNGTGTVYDDDGGLASVAYHLIVEQRGHWTPPTDREEEVLGPPRLTGTVTILSSNHDLSSRGTLTLHLPHDRRLDFVVTAHDPIPASHPLSIQPVGLLRALGGQRHT